MSDPGTSWDLKGLVAWNVAMDLASAVHQATREFPEDERFGLTAQLRRAAVSVASNIAEGHGRTGRKDFARYVLIARGSLKEVETQILLAVRFGYLAEGESRAILQLADRLNRLLTGLLRRLR